ncbi:MAG: hypothetical protein E7Z90_04430 [Cyanobacteria bacterium SIG29]|nr:hypothetical protein [Cyanobacteria bacterium SIG29]
MYNTIYPAYAKSYLGIQNKQIHKKKEEEQGSQSSKNADNNLQEERRQPNYGSHFPNGEKVAIDYTKRHIGIEQVLIDFRNTAKAIGTPDEINAEVSSYLSLIESQAQKENPNPQIIQANLKNASQILDDYITKTLKKPSKVVENWVDALFLQQIDYKAKTPKVEEPVQEDVIVEEVDEIVEETIPSEEMPISQTDSGVYIPQDPELKRMFLEAKKYAYADEKEQALSSFQNVLAYADEIGDSQACAMIHFEEARLYDDINRIEDALYNYDRAARQTQNNNIKAKSHMYMGKIYDDYVKLEPAIDHYCAAVSFAGEADNLKLQAKVLSNLSQVHTEKYDKNNALMFMDLSDTVATQTKDGRVMGFISSKNGNNCEKLGEKARALKYFGKSAGSYSSVGDNESLAKNYVSAAEIMLSYGNSAKAKKLLGKAFLVVQSTNNSELKKEITQKISQL